VSSPAFGGQCIVKDHYAQAETPSAPSVLINGNLDAPKRVGYSVQAQQWLGAVGGASPHKLSPEELVEREMFTAVMNDDLPGLKALLPKDSERRNAIIKKSGLLPRAASAGAILTFNQINNWDASALSTDIRENSLRLLDDALTGWFLQVQYKGRGERVEGRERAFVDIVNKLLSSGLLKMSAEQSGAALAAVAYIPTSPDVIEIGKQLLARGATIDGRGAYGRTALALALERQNIELVVAMMSAPRIPQEMLNEALASTPLQGDDELLAALLERGANINADVTKFGKSPRYPAADAAGLYKFAGRRKPLALLIKYGVDPNRVPPSGRSALMFAIHDHELMKGLIALGANVNQRDSDGNTPLLLATRIPTSVSKRSDDTRSLREIEPGIDPDIRRGSVEMLLQHGADPSIANNAGVTPLMQTTNADSKAIDLMMAKGGTVNARVYSAFFNQSESSPAGVVSAAILNGNDALASALLSRMVKIPSDECGAVYYAAETGAVKTLKVLLDKKADVYAAKSKGGKTPLHVAAVNGRLDAVKVLLETRSAKVDESTPVENRKFDRWYGPSFSVPAGRETALMFATANGHAKVVAELLARGADMSRRDIRGSTAVKYLRVEDMEIAKLLKVPSR